MISEVDLKDWERGPVTKLYAIPKDTYVEDVSTHVIMRFDKVLGSIGFGSSLDGSTMGLSMWADVYPLKEKE